MNNVSKNAEIEKYKRNYILSINSIFEAWKEAQNTDYPFNALTKENGDTFEINSFAQDGILLQSPQLSYEQRTVPDINQLIKALSASAVMNLNKRGGIGRCYKPLLRRYVKNESVAKCIYDEIKLINPDVIVLLATGEFLYSSKLPDKRRIVNDITLLKDMYL